MSVSEARATRVARRMRIATANGHGRAAPGRSSDTIEAASLDPALIDPSPFQPRQDFPEESIRALADSMAIQGQLRPKEDGRYELIDGERRLRAAKLLKHSTIRAEIRDMSDAEAREAVVVSALKREDLNPIEEARAYRQILGAGDVATQEDLAARLGVSQPHVSNRLRLLELPEEWQRRIITREISATHARHILPYVKYPSILREMAKRVRARLEDGAYPGSHDDFARDLEIAVREATRPLGREEYDARIGRWVPCFEPTPEQRDRLRLIEVPWGGKTEQRATNVALWNKLQSAHKEAWRKAHSVSERAAKKPTGRKRAKNPPDLRQMTPAERKKWEAAERARDEKEAKHRAELRERIRADWDSWLIAQYVQQESTGEDLLALLLELACSPVYDGPEALDAVAPPKKGEKRNVWLWEPWPMIHGRGRAGIAELARDFVAAAFWRPGKTDGDPGRPGGGERDVVARIADDLGIDRERWWLESQMGPLSEAYWNAHSRAELAALNIELGAGLPRELLEGPKDAVVKALLARVPKPDDKEVGLPMPGELRRRKAGRKGKRRKS